MAQGSVTGLDVEGLLRRLDEARVDHVLIGAVALAAHGPVRATCSVTGASGRAPRS